MLSAIAFWQNGIPDMGGLFVFIGKLYFIYKNADDVRICVFLYPFLCNTFKFIHIQIYEMTLLL